MQLFLQKKKIQKIEVHKPIGQENNQDRYTVYSIETPNKFQLITADRRSYPSDSFPSFFSLLLDIV